MYTIMYTYNIYLAKIPSDEVIAMNYNKKKKLVFIDEVIIIINFMYVTVMLFW